ncbi:MAG: DNA methylase [Selenomonas ruminantium]|nr:DNA methylase [Selenomonas ruminantium]
MDGESKRTYVAIDLKSFYASVECVERGLDPLDANLVVADSSRTDKTICLAVSPSLKSFGVSGRPRLFEVVQQAAFVNGKRKYSVPGCRLEGKSCLGSELKANPKLELDYIVATPQMAKYMEVSTRIYSIYLRFVAPEDIHIYSVDEVFIDAGKYLSMYKLDAHGFAMMLIREVLRETKITATAGIGTNMYLAKVAMDIVAKHMPPDKDGVRVAELDEISFREKLWSHKPLTDFWQIGKGIDKRLAKHGLHTMGDIARCSLGSSMNFFNEDLLYKEFGVKAEFIIDHAWGCEPVTIKDIKSYVPMSTSMSSGQVLMRPYEFQEARLVTLEMTEQLTLDLVTRQCVTPQLVLDVGYDIESLKGSGALAYNGAIHIDNYGRKVPAPAHGSINVEPTSSTKVLMAAMKRLFDRVANPVLLVRRITVTAAGLISERDWEAREDGIQELDLFADPGEEERKERQCQLKRKEKSLQQAVLAIKNKYGRNAMLRGMNFLPGATAIERNGQVGGHKA